MYSAFRHARFPIFRGLSGKGYKKIREIAIPGYVYHHESIQNAHLKSIGTKIFALETSKQPKTRPFLF